MTRTARAPGKLVFLGEYAVVDGAPAVVAGVDRYAVARATPLAGERWQIRAPTLGDASASVVPGAREVVRGPLRLACTLLEVLAGDGLLDEAAAQDIELDTAQLFAADGKLGLGSSAAVLAALHALLAPDEPRERAFSRIDRAHREAQAGMGSGVDVAAAVTGGVSIYTRGRPPAIEPIRLPPDVHWRAVYTGVAASTGEFLAAIAHWRRESPSAYGDYLAQLTALAKGGAQALMRADGETFCALAGDYGQALGHFGRAAGVDIESMEHTALSDVARRNGVHYKVSGAGGGDVGLAFSTDRDRLAAFAARVPAVDPRFEVLALAQAPAQGSRESRV